jgi:acrosin
VRKVGYDLKVSNLVPLTMTFNGGSGSNALLGADHVNTWTVQATVGVAATNLDAGTLADGKGTGTLTFTNVGNLVGGDDLNTFTVSSGLTGGMYGVGEPGLNTFSMTGTATTITRVTGLNSGTSTGIAGGFHDFAKVKGTPLALPTPPRKIEIVGPGLLRGSGSIDGGGNAILIGNNTGTTWEITGPDSGAAPWVNSGFTGIGSVVGGAGDDSFIVDSGVTFAGNIDGGGGNNTVDLLGTADVTGTITGGDQTTGVNDVLDLSQETGPITVDLAKGTYTVPGQTGEIDANFETVIGNGFDSTLIGANIANTWNITGQNAGTVNGITFSGFNNIQGGSASDTFNFTAAAAPIHVLDFSSPPGVDSPTGTSAGSGEADAERITVGDPPITGDLLARVRAHHPGYDASLTTVEGQALVADVDGNVTAADSHDDGNLFLNASGTFSFELISSADAVTSLALGASLTDTFAYTYMVGLQNFSDNLIITITKVADGFDLTDNVNSIDITGTVQGGSGPNQFNFASDALVTGHIIGGPGADTFTFDDTAWASGIVDGGPNPGHQPKIVDFTNATGSPNITVNTLQFINMTEFRGARATSILIGPDSPNAWIITGAGSGTLNGVPFTNVANLQGGTDTDTFIFQAGGSLSGSIDGGSGANTLETTGQGLTLTGLGLAGGFDGTSPSITGGFDNVETLMGGSTAADSLAGMNAAATWSLGTADTYNVSTTTAGTTTTTTLTFSGFTQLVGGTVADTFDITGAQAVSLKGGGGTSDFVFFTDGASVTGSIDGGGGQAALNWQKYSTARKVTLIAPSFNQGFSGTEASIGGGFADITGMAAPNSAGGTLIGMNAFATWNLPNHLVSAASDSYAVTISSNTLGFGGFTRLVGGSYSDTFDIAGSQPLSLAGGGGAVSFVFADGSNITGSIDGGSGPSTLDWSANTGARNVMLTSAGLSDGFNGTEATIGQGFSDIETMYAPATAGGTLTGWGSHSFTWNLPASGLSTYTGAGYTLAFNGFTHLAAPAGTFANTFLVAGSQKVSLTGAGGPVDFVFANGASIAGSIDGGSGPSTIDWSGNTGARKVVLTSIGTLQGFAGKEPSIASGFNNIANMIGSAAFTDSLSGLPTGGTWSLGAVDTYRSGSSVLTFSSFEQLSGPGVPDATTTAVGATRNSTGTATLSVQVGATDGVLPQGTVALYDGSVLLGVVTLVNGKALLTTGVLPAGNHTFTAVYSGDTKHNISVGSVGLSV